MENALNGKGLITSKALAGTIDTASGQKLTFAFFLNNVPVKEAGADMTEATLAAGRVLGRLCEVFYEYQVEATAVGSSR